MCPFIFQTKSKDWARINYKLEKLLNSFIESDISPIANAAMNEKERKVKFRVPRKIPLPEVTKSTLLFLHASLAKILCKLVLSVVKQF